MTDEVTLLRRVIEGTSARPVISVDSFVVGTVRVAIGERQRESILRELTEFDPSQ